MNETATPGSWIVGDGWHLVMAGKKVDTEKLTRSIEEEGSYLEIGRNSLATPDSVTVRPAIGLVNLPA